MNRRNFLINLGAISFPLFSNYLFSLDSFAFQKIENEEEIEKNLEEKVENMKIFVNIDQEMIIKFGKNTIQSSLIYEDELWLKIDNESFYGFSDIKKIDFDKDGKKDLIIDFQWGAYGSGYANGNIVVSSKNRTAQFYRSFSGAGFWFDKNLPSINNPFCILEIKDWMPTYSEIKGNNDDIITHPESIGFIFTHVWDGGKFKFYPVKEFYRKILGYVFEEINIAKSEDEQNSYKIRMYERIAKDFVLASKGEKISEETLQSSDFKLIKEIHYK